MTSNDSSVPSYDSGQPLTVSCVFFFFNDGATTDFYALPLPDAFPFYFTGTDTFTYTVTDKGTTAGVSDPKGAVGTVTVTVTEVNQPPGRAPVRTPATRSNPMPSPA